MDRCPDCGAPVEGGREGCQGLWDELSLAGVIPGPGFDAYCLQHLERYCKSAKSYAAHLTRFCCGVEWAGEPRIHSAIQRWLNGKVEIEKPALLDDLGTMTLADIQAGNSPSEQRALAAQWIDSVWVAYRPQHELARAWVDRALRGR